MELNAYPDRLDLCDVHLRMARERGIPIVINTDAHHTCHMALIKYGVLQARRAWLTASDVLNTLPWKRSRKAMKQDNGRGGVRVSFRFLFRPIEQHKYVPTAYNRQYALRIFGVKGGPYARCQDCGR